MTRRVNTELAKIRAAAKAVRQQQPPSSAEIARVQPAIAATLADVRTLVAQELRMMLDLQAKSKGMSLGDAKKLQALMSSLSQAESIEKSQEPDLADLSDEELDAELRMLQSTGTPGGNE